MSETTTISLEVLSHNANIQVSTIKKRLFKNPSSIPGITIQNGNYVVLSGTRYPYPKIAKLDNSEKKRYHLLKAISEYKYIDHWTLRLEQQQFINMLRELLSAGLIEPNHLQNNYGANAYDCTTKGDMVLHMKQFEALKEISRLIAETSGIFVGEVVSALYQQ